MRPVHQAGTVAALRSRLYQPDPPDDAVGRYLDALRQADRRAVPAPSARPARRPSGPAALAGGLLACCVALAAGAAVVPAGATATTAGAVRVVRPAAGLEAPPVTGVPLGALHGDGRPGAGRFSAGGEHAVVSVNCTGEGTLVIRVGPDEPVTLVCEAAAVAFALVPSRTGLDRFSVVATPDGPVRWSLSVGGIDLPAT